MNNHKDLNANIDNGDNGNGNSLFDVIVIGAGISGLTVAYELQKKGKRVLVLEANNRVGGRIFTDQVDDFTFEVGCQFISESFSETMGIIKELGIEADLERFHNSMYLQIKGVFQLVDQEALWHMIFPPGLTWRDRLKLRYLCYDMIKYWNQLRYQEIEKSVDIDGLTMEDYAFQRLNSHILRSLIAPVISSLYFMSPTETSFSIYLAMIKNMMKSKLYTFRGGLKKLPEALASKLNVRLGEKARRVAKSQSGWEVVTHAKNRQNIWSATNVVVAIPAIQAADLFTKAFDLSIKQSFFLRKQKYTKTCSLVTGYNHRMLPGAYSLIIPTTETSGVASIALEHEKYRNHVPRSYGLHTLYAHTHFTERIATLSESDKKIIILQEMEKIIPKYRQHVTWSKLYDIPIGIPHTYTHKAREVVEFQQEQRRNIQSGLVFCGDYLNWPSIEGSITVAKKTASMLHDKS